MIDTDKYENMRLLFLDFIDTASDEVDEEAWKDKLTALDELLAEVKRLREDYENMSEVLRERGMDICRHCRVIYHDDDMNHPHYPTLHPWHMDGMCMGDEEASEQERRDGEDDVNANFFDLSEHVQQRLMERDE